VVAGGLESVFIGHPIDGEDDAVGSRERVGALGHGPDILRFGTNLFLAATFRHFGPIGRLETDFRFFRLGSNDIRINNINLLEGVAAVGVHFAVGRHNFDGLLIPLRCGEGHGQESDSDDLAVHQVKIKG